MLVWAIGIGVGISLVAVAILGTSSTYNHCMVNFCAFYKWLGVSCYYFEGAKKICEPLAQIDNIFPAAFLI